MHRYSIASSARVTSVGGRVDPVLFACPKIDHHPFLFGLLHGGGGSPPADVGSGSFDRDVASSMFSHVGCTAKAEVNQGTDVCHDWPGPDNQSSARVAP